MDDVGFGDNVGAFMSLCSMNGCIHDAACAHSVRSSSCFVTLFRVNIRYPRLAVADMDEGASEGVGRRAAAGPDRVKRRNGADSDDTCSRGFMLYASTCSSFQCLSA